jgi:hypothetical protein
LRSHSRRTSDFTVRNSVSRLQNWQQLEHFQVMCKAIRSTLYRLGAKSFQKCTIHIKISGYRCVVWNRFHTKGPPESLGAIVKTVPPPRATWCPGIVKPQDHAQNLCAFDARIFLGTRFQILAKLELQLCWVILQEGDSRGTAVPSWLCLETVIRNLHETYQCRMYSRELLMKGS